MPPLKSLLRGTLLALPLLACGEKKGSPSAGGTAGPPPSPPALVDDFTGCWSMDKVGTMVLFRIDKSDGAYHLAGRNFNGEFKPAKEAVVEPSPDVLKQSLPRSVSPDIVTHALVTEVHHRGLDAFGLYKIKSGMSAPGKAADSDYVAENTGPVYRVVCPQGK